MPVLAPPSAAVHRSYLDACAEQGREVGGLVDPEAFAQHVAALRARALATGPDADGRVPTTVLWWVDGGEYLGGVSVRHGLTPGLRHLGGHIGYAVRPSARRRGHATAMLRAALPWAADLGIDPALVTVLEGNAASRAVVEACGGELAEVEDDVLRYWLPTT